MAHDCDPPVQYEGDDWTCADCGREWIYLREDYEYTDEVTGEEVHDFEDWYEPRSGW